MDFLKNAWKISAFFTKLVCWFYMVLVCRTITLGAIACWQKNLELQQSIRTKDFKGGNYRRNTFFETPTFAYCCEKEAQITYWHVFDIYRIKARSNNLLEIVASNSMLVGRETYPQYIFHAFFIIFWQMYCETRIVKAIY